MLPYLRIYSFAILLALAIAGSVTRHHPAAAPSTPNAAAFHTGLAPRPVPPPSSAFAPTQVVEPDRSGHFFTPVEIDGRRLTMLVDTGASFLSLTSEDADELGIRPAPADFTVRMQTANGLALAAHTFLPKVQVGNVTVHDVEAIIMAPRASAKSLLGMSFLGKLHGFRVADGRLRLEQ